MSSLHISPKISLPKLSNQDISVISNACSKYAQDLGLLLENQNRAQQHIHHSILQQLRYDLLKRLTNRYQAEHNNLKMETFTAFVCYDALQHYSNHCDSYLEQAIIRRIVMQLFQFLPVTSDKNLSIHSELNFER